MCLAPMQWFLVYFAEIVSKYAVLLLVITRSGKLLFVTCVPVGSLTNRPCCIAHIVVFLQWK